MWNFIKNRLSPFQHVAFRRFFFVQAVSQVGTWSHDLARAWIVLEIMGTASALGSLMLASAIPTFLLILHGGVLVDRIDAKKVMIGTKAILAVSALILSFVVEFAHIQMWHLFVFGIIEGLVLAFDSPAYQTLTVRLVPRQDFQQAMAINSTNFHTGRMLGPAVAGLLMAWHGPSAVFLFDALSYIGLIFVLGKIDLRAAQRTSTEIPKKQLHALYEGLKYMFTNSRMRYMLLQLLLTITMMFPVLIVVFRTYIKEKFSLDADSFGYVFAFPALGAMLGALVFTGLKPQNPMRVLVVSVPTMVGLLIGLTYADDIMTASIIMGFSGLFSYLNFAPVTMSMHLDVVEDYRGRMGSLIGMCFLSIGPIMSFPIGAYSDHVGYEEAIRSISLLYFSASLLLAVFRLRNRG